MFSGLSAAISLPVGGRHICPCGRLPSMFKSPEGSEGLDWADTVIQAVISDVLEEERVDKDLEVKDQVFEYFQNPKVQMPLVSRLSRVVWVLNV